MNKFTYRVYYKYNGPSHSDPLRTPKDSNEIAEALRVFPSELPHYFSSDHDATVFSEQTNKETNSIIVVVGTVLDEENTDEGVIKCLNGLDLFGEKLKKN